jgi:hypothetical protein
MYPKKSFWTQIPTVGASKRNRINADEEKYNIPSEEEKRFAHFVRTLLCLFGMNSSAQICAHLRPIAF